MQADRTCEHGHIECTRCVNEATERAKQVEKHYLDDLERDHARVVDVPAGTATTISSLPPGTRMVLVVGPPVHVGKIPPRQDIPIGKAGQTLVYTGADGGWEWRDSFDGAS